MARVLGRDIARAHIQTISKADLPQAQAAEPVCAQCRGVGWLRREAAVGDPGFGRVFPCVCRADTLARLRLDGVVAATNFPSLERMTFANFQVAAPGNPPEGKESLRAACEAAQAYAQEPAGWLLLTGSYGCGKTHLAAAVVNEQLKRGSAALFVVVPDLLDHLRAGIGNDDGVEERLVAVRDAPLLVLDDLGAEAATPWANEKLYRILNHRYNAGLPTVITTNDDLDALDDRLRSRLGHLGMVTRVDIRALDYRGGVDHDRMDLSHLDKYRDLTFQGWDHRMGSLDQNDAANLGVAYEAARTFAEARRGWLVLMGASGVGKTHLAAAAANYRAAKGDLALFVVVPDLLDHLRATFSPTSKVTYDHRFDEVREAPILILDDLGTESATPWAREKLFQILNHRYVAEMATIITTSNTLSEIPARLRTRMLDKRRCRIVAMTVPPYHGPASGRGGA